MTDTNKEKKQSDKKKQKEKEVILEIQEPIHK